ncbi:MAG: hypothetical protein HOC95_02540 [Candidatus Diapherotrites archaeon]|nr:hypothetical protein [Candidatus Diapherotrites archaeon]
MNYYAFLTFLIIALLMLYIRLSWMGIIFIVLAIVVAIYNPAKTNVNTAWEQMSAIDGKSPEKKFEGYTKTVAKQFAQGINKEHLRQEYDLKNAPKKSGKLAQNVIDSVKDLFN